MNWSTDRRGFLAAGGAFLTALAGAPKLAWAADGSTLRIRVAADFQVLDPFGEIGGLDEIIPRMCTVTLCRMPDMRAGHAVIPYAAKVYEWTSPTTLAFTLHDGLIWSGGFGPVTAEDVKYSYERIRGSDSAWAYQFEKLDHVEVTGEKSGILHLTEAFKPFEVIALPYYGGHLVCKAATEAAGGRFTTEMPAQCGPYLFDTWEQNARVTLKRNPDWPLAMPQFDTVEIYIVTDDQPALLAYEADAFDFTPVAVASAADLKADPPAGSALIEAASTHYIWLNINMNAEPLRDLRVRQAIQYAYDSDAVLQGAYGGLTGRAAGVIQPGTSYSRSVNKIATRDVAKARELLAEAGAEGLVLNLYCMSDSVSLAVAQIIQASLNEAGITIEVQPTEDAAYWALGDKTQGEGYKSIELVLMNFAGGVDPTENLVWFRPDQIGVYNWSFFDSAEYEDLYQKSLTEQDEAVRAGMFHRMEDLMEESGGFVFICFEPYLAIHDANLTPVILPDGYPDPTRFTAS
ncbi:MAG: ABC transporter substrate-binding protein [Gemmobacter sp.]|jgi:peptide/nickel transport system substrate-binding protein|nr:ABC transporter substrate-binding protein [Gemmobacter sp.]